MFGVWFTVRLESWLAVTTVTSTCLSPDAHAPVPKPTSVPLLVPMLEPISTSMPMVMPIPTPSHMPETMPVPMPVPIPVPMPMRTPMPMPFPIACGCLLSIAYSNADACDDTHADVCLCLCPSLPLTVACRQSETKSKVSCAPKAARARVGAVSALYFTYSMHYASCSMNSSW